MSFLNWIGTLHPAYIMAAQLALLALAYRIVCWITGGER